MAMSGFALGGAASGFDASRALSIDQQKADQSFALGKGQLAIQQQAEQHKQQREMYARADAARAQTMDIVKQTISAAQTQAAISGQPLDTDKLSKSLMPMVQAASKNAESSGVPGGSGMILSQFTAMLANARAATTPQQNAALATKQRPGSAPLSSSDVPQPTNVADVGGTPMPPGQNITGPGTTVTGVDYGEPETNPATQRASRLSAALASLPDDAPKGLRESIHLNLATELQKSKSEISDIVSPEQKRFIIGQIAHGNMSGLVGLGRFAGGAKLRMELIGGAAQTFIDKGLPPEVANAAINEFAAQKSGAQSLGQLQARTTAAIAKAEQTAPRVLEISSQIDRTKYPSLNKVILAVKEGTGDEKVVRLNTAVETLINNYAMTLGMGNSVLTDFSRNRASDLLNRAYSSGQMSAVISQMMIEMKSEQSGLGQAMPRFLSETQILPGQQQQNGGAGAAPVVHNAMDYFK